MIVDSLTLDYQLRFRMLWCGDLHVMSLYDFEITEERSSLKMSSDEGQTEG